MLAWSQPSTNRLLASRYVQELQSALQSYGKIVVYKKSIGTTKKTYEQRGWRKKLYKKRITVRETAQVARSATPLERGYGPQPGAAPLRQNVVSV